MLCIREKLGLKTIKNGGRTHEISSTVRYILFIQFAFLFFFISFLIFLIFSFYVNRMARTLARITSMARIVTRKARWLAH